MALLRRKLWIAVQTIGGGFIVYGAHQLWNTGVAAIVGGVLLVIAGMLGEAGESERQEPTPTEEGEGDGTRPTD